MENNQELGRSMIEMLGVLAIIGILSVGSFSGFSKVMSKYKTIKEVEKYNLFVQNMMMNKSLILKSGEALGSATFIFYTKDIEMLGILPQGWVVKGSNIYDTMGHHFNLYSTQTRNNFVMGLYINNKKEEKADTLFCMQMWQNFILPNQEWIGNVWVNGSGGKSGNYYGRNYCTVERKCLSNVNLEEMQKFCTSCAKETVCNIIVTLI